MYLENVFENSCITSVHLCMVLKYKWVRTPLRPFITRIVGILLMLGFSNYFVWLPVSLSLFLNSVRILSYPSPSFSFFSFPLLFYTVCFLPFSFRAKKRESLHFFSRLFLSLYHFHHFPPTLFSCSRFSSSVLRHASSSTFVPSPSFPFYSPF